MTSQHTTPTSIANLRWVGTSQLIRVICQLVGIPIYSRLLSPADYGLLAMATVILTLANTIRDMGTSTAIIQTRKVTKDLLSTIFWFNIIMGCGLGLIIVSTSSLVAFAFREPRLRDAMLVLAMVFPISSAGALQLSLMERDSRFREVAWVETSSSIIALVLGLIAAWDGFGAYSLIIQIIIGAALTTLQLWFVTPWRPALIWKQSEVGRIWRFSSNLTAFNIVNFLETNIDNMLIGSVLGARDLGWYNLSYRIMLFPIQTFTFVISRSLFPLYSKYTLPEIRIQYMKVITLLAYVTGPLTLGLWSVRMPAVEVMLGEKWLPVATLLTWLGPTAFLRSLTASTGFVLLATSNTHILRNLGIFSAVTITLCFIIAVNFGVEAIVIGYLAVSAIDFFVAFYFTLSAINLQLTDLSRCLWQPTLFASIMAAIIAVANNHLAISHVGALQRLLILVPSGVVIFGGLIATFSPNVLAECKHALSSTTKDRANS